MAAFAGMTAALPEGRLLPATTQAPLADQVNFIIDCDVDTVVPTGNPNITVAAVNISTEDCKNYLKWAQYMYDEGANYTWEAYEFTTSDGYELSMMRIIGDPVGEMHSN